MAVADVQAVAVAVAVADVLAGRTRMTPRMRVAFPWHLQDPLRRPHRLDVAASARTGNHQAQAAMSIFLLPMSVMIVMIHIVMIVMIVMVVTLM